MGIEKINNASAEINEWTKRSIMDGEINPEIYVGKTFVISYFYFETPSDIKIEKAKVSSVEVADTLENKYGVDGPKIVTFMLDNKKKIELNFDTIEYSGDGVERDKDGAYPSAEIAIQN